MIYRQIPILAVLLIMIAAMSQLSAQDDLSLLAEWMTGSFSSEEQAASDSQYFDIRLEMVRIWEGREDGYWLYVEQAAASALDRPYRQRIYHVTPLEDGRFSSAVYSLPDPMRFAGSWADMERLNQLDPDSLTIRKGCAVILARKSSGAFEGSTVKKACESKLRGASYATSIVTVMDDRIVSWDQGFNADDEQVWGATQGGYIFKKKAKIIKN